jgi:hypothetical protein
MPPNWVVLATFYIAFDLPLVPLVLGSAVASALGRIGLAWLTPRLGSRWLQRQRREAAALGAWATRRRTWRWWLVAVGYFLGPFPSNVPFVAAGAGRFSVRRLALAYAGARAVSDMIWVWSAGEVAPGAADFVREALTDWRTVVAQVAAVVALILLFWLPWSMWLRRR